jgi:bifunctional NMN adenylyltransferase/nudix hydrolase
MKIAYVIGRFQPFHNAHARMITKALSVADKVHIIIGDTGCRPDFKNPWSVDQRIEMIRASEFDLERLTFSSVEDNPYDDKAWAAEVRIVASKGTTPEDELFLVGHKKDATSFYLDLFPNWKFVESPAYGTLNATSLRENFFDGGAHWSLSVPGLVAELVNRWAVESFGEFDRIAAEYKAIKKHNAEWDCPAVRKYGGPVIAAVDTVLFDDTHVLLIRRGGGVGKGALALPGGFVDPSEWLVDAALRELEEETGIKLTRTMFVEEPFVIPFGYPGRSMRGRIITNVLAVYSPNHFVERPEPVAGDDADEAMWVPISELQSLKREFFSDHYHIVQHTLPSSL